MTVQKRKLQTKITILKNFVGKMKTSLEIISNRVTAIEDKICELEDERHNNSILQKRLESILKKLLDDEKIHQECKQVKIDINSTEIK